ncbi:MAG: hypothetical protein ACLPWS_18420 [Rhodomicrobium sp.]
MFATRKLLSGLAATLALGALAAGCDSSMFGSSSPVSGAKEVLLGRAAPSPDLPERPKLVIPPPNAPLPEPGQSTAVSMARQWAPTTEAPKKEAQAQAQDAAPKKEESSGWFSGLFGSSEMKKSQ